MNRQQFMRKCGMGCIGIIAMAPVLSGCASIHYEKGTIVGSDLEVPESAFVFEKKGASLLRAFVIVENNKLKYPILLKRIDDSNYKAVLMRCTHQGTVLSVFGDRLQCSAHGSEFSTEGKVQNGPAEENLKKFPTMVDKGAIKINLS